jgi:uncharacterized DUF497 family protein
MEFDGFNWDDGNRDKCQKHGVSLVEIEGVFHRPVLILPDRENPMSEQRFRVIGSSPEGRKIFLVFTWRQHEGAQLIRPISARYMHRPEVEHYEKSYPDIQDG